MSGETVKHDRVNSTGPPVLSVTGLRKSFRVPRAAGGGLVRAVAGIDLVVGRGEIVGLVGESGSGKTTVAHCVLRLLEPDGGQVSLDGTDITHLPRRKLLPLRPKMHMVFQDPYSSLNPRMTVGDIVAAPLHAQRTPGRAGKVAEMLTQVGLSPQLRSRYPHKLSGGQRQRVLEAGDPGASVAAVFSWSTRQLSNDAARMFRLLGLHPGPDISVHAAASLAAVNESQARRLLRELTRHCLITEHAPGRYAFHDLLRAYAARQARDHDSAPDRDAAVGRILDHYLHTAAHATFLLQSAREKVDLAVPRRGVVPEQPGDHRQALAWFEAEHQVLLAAVTMALDMGADSHAWQLPWAMAGYLYRRGYQRERVTILGNAVAAATRLDDIFGQATSLRALGSACIGAGDYDQARVHLERCLLLYRRLDDRQGQAWTHVGFSRLAEVQGRYADALDHGEQALGLYQAIGDQSGEALVLNSLAWDHALLGDYLKARAFAEWPLVLITKLSDCDFECHVWATLGYTALHLGDSSHAAAHFESALSLCRDYGDRYSEAEILLHAGNARHAAGDLLQARQAGQQALAIYHDLQHPDADKVHAQLASTKGQLPGC